MRVSKSNLALVMLKAGVDSSKRLAELSGVSVNTISRINNGGSAKLPTVRRLAVALGCDPAEIIEQEG